MKIHSNIHDYEVLFQTSISFFDELAQMPHKVVVMDRKIHQLYPELSVNLPPEDLILIDATEDNKTLDAVQDLLKKLVVRDEKRNLTLISIGGGIIQDITGYTASCLYRGINWLFIPTTLLAQADSCVGSKTSINFEGYKNIVGGFYPPHRIYLYPGFLDSLPDTDFFSGVGEIVKFMLLDDTKIPDFNEIKQVVNQLQQKQGYSHAIECSLAVKQSYINQDEFDSGKRNLFNYGHCFGHALEVSSKHEVPHGIAVTLGMIYANLVARERGWLSDDVYDQLNRDLFLPIIPIELKAQWFDEAILLAALKNDKKRVGKDLTIILPSSDKIEAVKVNDLTADEFQCTLAMFTNEILAA